jgi:purine-nucleoside phosphorylase
VALVLGSGLGDYAGRIRVEATLDYSAITEFPVSTVPGHAGRFVFGYVEDVPVVCMQGRVHYYEGYPMEEVVLPIRLMRQMGAGTLILTNAAGGIQQGMKAGDLMLLTGQIASFVPSPLIGENMDELGPRFPDMSEIYNRDLIYIARKCASSLGIDWKEGTYLQFSGPAYESPQEVAMARILGADAVGMSTACEAVAANHMGMKIMGISCISNLASGISPQPLSHEEVQKAADEVAPKFQALVTQIIREIGKTCR